MGYYTIILKNWQKILENAMSDAFFEALKSLPSPSTVEKQYRLYYDPDSGEPLFYTSDDEPGTYIVVDKKTYNIGNYHCRVVNNKIENLNKPGSYQKLVPADEGCTVNSTNIMIISQKGKCWKLKTYEN